MQKQNEKNVFFLTEVKQVDLLDAFLAANPSLEEEGLLIIPLDVEIEYLLAEKGIPCFSGRNSKTPDPQPMVLAEKWPGDIFNNPRWSFFAYRGVSIGKLYYGSLIGYLFALLYIADVIANVIEKHKGLKRFIVFPPLTASPFIKRCLIDLEIRVFSDAVSTIAKQRGLEVLVPPVPTPAQGMHSALFTLKRKMFGVGLALLNTAIVLVRPRPRIRILASTYWRYLESYIKQLPSAEVILLDRAEIVSAGFSNIWRSRMRFLHIDTDTRRSVEREAMQALFRSEWEEIRSGTDFPMFKYRGFSFFSLMESAIEAIVDETIKKTLGNIDATHAMLERLKPDVVLVRATSGAQTHFGILALASQVHGIPSVEMQHGIEYYGDGSENRRHNAQYTGMYGPLNMRQAIVGGDNNTHHVVIGSPRFDVYAALLKEQQKAAVANGKEITFLCIAPIASPWVDTDIYDVEEYFMAIGAALKKIPNARAIIKLRPGPNRDSFTRKIIASAFGEVPYAVAQFEPLQELYPAADVVVSCFSTAAFEAIQCGKPLVFLGISPIHQMMGKDQFEPFVKADAMRMATSRDELDATLYELGTKPTVRERLSKNAVAFLDKEFAFDGKASERAAKLIEDLAAKREVQ